MDGLLAAELPDSGEVWEPGLSAEMPDSDDMCLPTGEGDGSEASSTHVDLPDPDSDGEPAATSVSQGSAECVRKL